MITAGMDASTQAANVRTLGCKPLPLIAIQSDAGTPNTTTGAPKAIPGPVPVVSQASASTRSDEANPLCAALGTLQGRARRYR